MRRLQIVNGIDEAAIERHFEYLYVVILGSGRHKVCVVVTLPGSDTHYGSLMSARELTQACEANQSERTKV